MEEINRFNMSSQLTSPEEDPPMNQDKSQMVITAWTRLERKTLQCAYIVSH